MQRGTLKQELLVPLLVSNVTLQRFPMNTKIEFKEELLVKLEIVCAFK